MMSLFDYTGHPDKDGTGLKVNAYARYRKQKYVKRLLDNGIEVFLYTREFIDDFFAVQKILKG